MASPLVLDCRIHSLRRFHHHGWGHGGHRLPDKERLLLLGARLSLDNWKRLKISRQGLSLLDVVGLLLSVLLLLNKLLDQGHRLQLGIRDGRASSRSTVRESLSTIN